MPGNINELNDDELDALRRKIEKDAKNPQHIITVHTIGYKFVP